MKTSTSIPELNAQERSLISDICALRDAADAAKNMSENDALRVSNPLLERMGTLVLELETSTLEGRSVAAAS